MWSTIGPGANGLVGANAVVRAEPDGYTLLLAPREVFGINPVLQPQQAHDWQKDLAYVGIVSSGPYVLVINPRAWRVRTLNELVALAESQELNYASFGNGSMAHLNIEALCRMYGLQDEPCALPGERRRPSWEWQPARSL